MSWHIYKKGFHSYLALERSMSKRTVDAYLLDVQKLVDFFEIHQREISPLDVQTADIETFIAWINKLGLSGSSQARILSGIKAFFKYLALEDLLENNPAELIDTPRLTRKIPTVLSLAEIDRMTKAIDHSTWLGLRNRAILEVLYACGLRVSELTEMQLNNLFLDIGFIKVIGKNNKERLVPIGETAIKHLNYYLQERRKFSNIKKGEEGIVFLNRRGKRLTRVMIFTIIKDLALAAGIQHNVSPHTFRHSFATHLVEGGANLKAVQDMLGHESITTTEIYTHLDKIYLKEIMNTYHPRSKPPKSDKNSDHQQG